MGHLDFKSELVTEMEPDWRCPAEWAEGPIKNPRRGCTDGFFLFFFFLVLALMIATAIWAFYNQDPLRFGKVYDSTGNVCGTGAATNFKTLYLQTFEAPYKSVCVEECPSFDYNQIKYNSSGVSTYSNGTIIPPMDAFEFSETFAGPSFTSSSGLTPAEAFQYNQIWANNYFSEDQFHSYANRWQLNCLHNQQFMSCENNYKNYFYIHDTYNVLERICVPSTPKAAMLYNKITQKFQGNDLFGLLYAYPLFFWVAISVLAFSLIFMIMTICCTGMMTFCLFFASAFSFIILGALFVINLLYTGVYNDPFNAIRLNYLQFIVQYRIFLLVVGVVFILVGIIILCKMCKYKKYLSASLSLIKMATQSSLKNCMLVFLSIFIVLLQIFVFLLEVYIIITIYSCGEEKTDHSIGMPFANYQQNWVTYIMMGLHIFGTYWLMVVLNNFNDFLTSAVAVNFYWKTNIPSWRIFCHSLGHHLGSVAWSIVLLPMLIFKLPIGWIDWLVDSPKPNVFQKCIRVLFAPCFWCYDKLFDRIDESYFAITYLGVQNFCPASNRLFYLTEKYSDTTSTLMMAGTFYELMSKVLVTIFGTLVGYLIYINDLKYQQNISNVFLLFLIIVVESCILGSIFINLFSTTYDAIAVCFLVEYNIFETSGIQVKYCPVEVKASIENINQINAGHSNYRKLN